MTGTPRLPAVFFAHGSPMVAIEEDDFTAALRRFGASVRPRAIVVVSAHWEAPGPIRVTASERPSMIYDFSGFPDELYQIRYASPGDPGLAAQIVGMLTEKG